VGYDVWRTPGFTAESTEKENQEKAKREQYQPSLCALSVLCGELGAESSVDV